MKYVVRPNRAKQKLHEGKAVRGFLMDVPSAELVEILGLLGYDSFMLEGEHHIYDEAFYLSLIRAGELWGMSPQIRISTIHPDQICRLLDLGLQGIHYTHVVSAEDARNLVRAAKYYPEGERGFGRWARVNLYGLTDEREAIEAGNDAIYLAVAIEDMQGVDHIEEICQVPSIDHVVVGPSDLAASMGHAGDYDNPEVERVLRYCHETIQRLGKGSEGPYRRPFTPLPGGPRVVGGAAAHLVAALMESIAHSPEKKARLESDEILQWR
ncbi:MAG TPA: aldolase/citrate lyase family protein [Chloroflexota bacterium]|jgi:2-keto-3-deoxy-L-rhamnonate aldolase RhmA|nr:aldolase/citrate lyase family protein [Chloroflexota bacterium]